MKILNTYINATNTHNFDNLVPLIAESAIYYFSNATVTTRAEIRGYFENAWHTIVDEVYSATDVIQIEANEYTQVFLYTYRYEGYMGGKFVCGNGRATNVFKLIDDRWQLIHEHLSATPSI